MQKLPKLDGGSKAPALPGSRRVDSPWVKFDRRRPNPPVRTAFQSAAERERRAPTIARDRSVHHKRPFVGALLATALHYLAIVTMAAGLVLVGMRRDHLAGTFLGASLAAVVITWVPAYLRRRSARCPLCRGTPFLDSRARPHRKARRLPPFNHGTTAILGSLFRQRFRCMYCGTRFDLLKPVRSRTTGAGR